MRLRTLILPLLLLAATPTPAAEPDADALKAEAGAVIKDFFDTLRGELFGAMQSGGPLTALAVCTEKAPALAKAKSTGGWTVARTTLRTRNPGNAPDAWEKAALDDFAKRHAAGEELGKLVKAEIVTENGQQTFRFLKAIGTDGPCLNCHGAELKPEVAARIDQLYPQDKAKGYKEGDFRGAFTLKKKL
ncbi:MAG: DUF3365 domain-containing protein [Rhodospirillales bacterium]|nr:DUF3365 domain-containing protein [Rhodospirillales bacterium]